MLLGLYNGDILGGCLGTKTWVCAKFSIRGCFVTFLGVCLVVLKKPRVFKANLTYPHLLHPGAEISFFGVC